MNFKLVLAHMILRSRKQSWGCGHGGSQGDSARFVKVHIVFYTPCMAQQLGCVLVATAAVGFGGIGMVDQKRTLQMRVGLFLLFDNPYPYPFLSVLFQFAKNMSVPTQNFLILKPNSTFPPLALGQWFQ